MSIFMTNQIFYGKFFIYSTNTENFLMSNVIILCSVDKNKFSKEHVQHLKLINNFFRDSNVVLHLWCDMTRENVKTMCVNKKICLQFLFSF